jgi:hypothetical protein
MIDQSYDAHERVQHRHISAKQPGNRHRDKQPVHHKSPPFVCLDVGKLTAQG